MPKKRYSSVNRVTRHIASEYIVMGQVAILHGVGLLWKAANSYKEGLTPGEQEYIKKRMETIRLATHELRVIRQRTLHTGRTR